MPRIFRVALLSKVTQVAWDKHEPKAVCHEELMIMALTTSERLHRVYLDQVVDKELVGSTW